MPTTSTLETTTPVLISTTTSGFLVSTSTTQVPTESTTSGMIKNITLFNLFSYLRSAYYRGDCHIAQM